MDFWAQFWSAMWGAIAGAVIAGGASGIIAWRSWTAEKNRRADELKRRLVERVLEVLGEAFAVVSGQQGVDAARSVTVQLRLATDQLGATLSRLDRERFQYWAFNFGEQFIANADWQAPQRDRIDAMRQRLGVATEQVLQWARGDATTAEIILRFDDAVERFQQTWTASSIGLE